MAKKQLYWLGPGTFGVGKNALNPGDLLPGNFSGENLKRFKNKIGEKVERGILDNTKELKEENKELKDRLESIEIDLGDEE